MFRIAIPVVSFFLVSFPLLAQPSGVERMDREVTRLVTMTTEEGEYEILESVNSLVEAPVSLPAVSFMRNWRVHDDVATPVCVSIDHPYARNGRVWTAWNFNTPRLSSYPVWGDGTPQFEFPSSHGLGCVVSAKGADRVLFGIWSRIYAFNSWSETPEWSFTFPAGVTASRSFAISHDGSTAAVVGRVSEEREIVHTLYIFNAETGEVINSDYSWTVPSPNPPQGAVELTDDGSLAIIGEFPGVATVIDTQSGRPVFQTTGSGNGDASTLRYKISGDGRVLVVGGFRLDVYRFNERTGTYEQIIAFSLPNTNWFGKASNVSRDGSTVGVLTRIDGSQSLEVEAFLFDVKTASLIGSYSPPAGSVGEGQPRRAASSDDGSVWAFASWGTHDQAWPEVMVFNRDVELIGELNHHGSANSVDVSFDGRFVAATFRNEPAPLPSVGGHLQLMDLVPSSAVYADDGVAQAPAVVLSTPSPNPVSETSTFTIGVERTQKIAVEVFDATGRHVQTLYEGVLGDAVRETLSLNASALPAGPYVIRATGEDFIETQSVMVVQ